MQNFKKNLGFNLALIAIAALFIVGCALAFLAYQGSTKSALDLARARRDQLALLNGHSFVPGAAAVSSRPRPGHSMPTPTRATPTTEPTEKVMPPAVAVIR